MPDIFGILKAVSQDVPGMFLHGMGVLVFRLEALNINTIYLKEQNESDKVNNDKIKKQI